MLTIGRLHRFSLTMTGAIAGLSVISGAQVVAVAAAVMILVLVVSSGRLLDTARSRPFEWLIYGLTICGLLGAFVVFKTSRIDAVLLVLMLGIFNRFLLRHGQRDDFLIVGTASTLITAATTVTPGIVFLPIILCFFPAVLWSLWTGMILGTVEGQHGPSASRGAVKQMADRPAPPFLRFIALGGVALMLFGFIGVSVLPRYRFSRMLGAGYFMSLPGASDSMELRTNGVDAIDDSTEVLRVKPQHGVGSGIVSGLYARTYVLDHFDGRTFRSYRSKALFPLHLPADKLPDGSIDSELAEGDGRWAVRITMSRTAREGEFQPIATLGRHAPSEVVRQYVRQIPSGAWTVGQFPGTTITYKAKLDSPFNDPRLPQMVQERVDARLLELPSRLDPRVIALGKELTDGQQTPEKKVNAVLRYLSKGFVYSLAPLPGESQDPLVRFLFEAKQGHCELYAAALAVLLRVGGLKTRVATGYYSGTWNDIGEYLAFTQQDAHAWVEVYIDGEGWRWIDATPEDLRSARRTKAMLSYVRDWYGAAEALWYDHVIDFDEQKRAALMSKVWGEVSGLIPGLDSEESETAGTAAARTSGPLKAVAFAIGVSLPLVLLLVALRRRRERTPESLGARLRTVLGARPGENRTLGTLIDRAPPPVRSRATKAVGLYEALRFGPKSEAPSPDQVVLAVKSLEQGLKEARRVSR